MVNGDYGTMEQLVFERHDPFGFARPPAISVGSPAGGYTIVGNSGCNDVPVAG